MEYFVEPVRNFSSEITAPPSKYITHRAIFIASLKGGSVLNYSKSLDCISSIKAIEKLGSKVKMKENLIEIESIEEINEGISIDAGNSGTTARFSAALSLLGNEFNEITGDESLRNRPMEDAESITNYLGGKLEYVGKKGYFPIKIKGPIRNFQFKVNNLKSTQFISGLLIASSRLQKGFNLLLERQPDSMGYIITTIQMLEKIGINYGFNNDGIYYSGKSDLAFDGFNIPGDFSSAAFFLVAAIITNSTIKITNLNLELFQPDSKIIDILKNLCVNLEVYNDSIEVRPSKPCGEVIDLRSTPDLFPIMAVLAASMDKNVKLIGSESLAYKESNRLLTTLELLRNLGVKAELNGNSLIVSGGFIRGGHVDSHGDHRIAMAAAIAGLGSIEGVSIENFDLYKISYPEFLDHLKVIVG